MNKISIEKIQSHHLMEPEVEHFLSINENIRFVDLLIADLSGVMRGKRIDVESLDKIYQEGVNLPMSIFSMSILGETIEECGLGLEAGEPDLTCFPLNNSLVPASWHQHNVAQLLMTMKEQDGSPFYAEPRNVLESACFRLRELGLTAVVAVELEFYLFDKKRTRSGSIQAPISPKTQQRDRYTQVYSVDTLAEYSDFLDDISRTCQEQNVPADTAVAEYAPGQFEINLKHQADPLVACDNALLLKRIVKAIADKHGFDCSFMAKPYGDEAGSGMHVHASILNEHGENIFADENSDYSKQLEFAIGGLLALLPASMPFVCPNINSYKRFQPNSYVADSLSWGLDNRTVALRIPKSNKAATRIEHRVAGADANPYLVMSVIINSIHYGLLNKITPIKPLVGDATQQEALALPNRLNQALIALEQDNVLTNNMGETFTQMYLTAKRGELAQIESNITDIELNWYLKNA